MKDYYQILGISFNSTSDEIKTAYRKMALKYHPDRNNDEKYFTEKFQLILEAYEILSNADKRNEYDELFKSTYDIDIIILPDYVRGIAKEEIIFLEKEIISLIIKEHLIDRMSYIFCALNLFQTYCENSPTFNSLAEEIKFLRKAPILPLIEIILKSKQIKLVHYKQSEFIETYKKEQLERYSITDKTQENYLWARSLFIDNKIQENAKLITFEYYKIVNYYSCFMRNSSN